MWGARRLEDEAGGEGLSGRPRTDFIAPKSITSGRGQNAGAVYSMNSGLETSPRVSKHKQKGLGALLGIDVRNMEEVITGGMDRGWALLKRGQAVFAEAFIKNSINNTAILFSVKLCVVFFVILIFCSVATRFSALL